MKQLRFKKVRYKNIMSVGASPITVELDTHHKTLCTGKNGAGKSTLLEAIYFALCGKPFRDIKKNQLINNINKKGLEVELWLDYHDDEYYIQRGIKPNKFKILKNGKELDEAASIKDFQEYFEKLIGMTSTSFKQVVVLGTAGYTPFMQLKTPERRRLVEDLLEVSVLADMDKLNKARLREVTQAIGVSELKINHLEQQKQTHVAYQEKQKQNSTENISRYETMYQELVERAKGHRATIDELTIKINEIVLGDDPAHELGKFQSAKYKLQSQFENFSAVKNLHTSGGTCPTCMQAFTDHKVLSGISDTIDNIENKLSKVDTKVSELNALVSDYNTRKHDIMMMTNDVRHNNGQLQTCIQNAKQIKDTIVKLQAEVKDNSAEIQALSDQINAEIQVKSNLVMEKYHRSNITELLKDSGVKASIIKKYIPYFNQRIAHYLNIMDADFAFTLDEEFNEVIKSQGREDFSYASFSQGEKARIDLSLLFTWRDVAAKVSGVEVNALFLDEVFDGPSDNDCVRAIFEILESMNSNIFVISHNNDIDPQKFDRHIKMAKAGRFSVCTID